MLSFSLSKVVNKLSALQRWTTNKPWLHHMALALLFLFSLGWFAILQPWGRFTDVDGFYHAKMADIILHGTSMSGALGTQMGPFFFLQSFPWLDLTSLHTNFVDQHLLYHLLLTPFVAIFGMLQGTQVAVIFLAAANISIFFVLLRWLRVQHALFWLFLALVSIPVAFRFSLPKASSLVLAEFLLGLSCIIFQSLSNGQSRSQTVKMYILGFLSGSLFALSHGGWMILLLAQAVYIGGLLLFDVLLKRPIAIATSVKIFFTTLAGMVVGILLHPNRDHLLAFLKVQIFQVAVRPPQGITLGMEWGPIAPHSLIANIAPLLMVSCVILLAFLTAVKKPLDILRARSAIGLGCVVAVMTALTFQSVRMVEYLVPCLILWLASLWTCIDAKAFLAELKQSPKNQRRAYVTLGALFFLLIFFHDVPGTFFALRDRYARSFSRLNSVVDTLKTHATPGERIFHDRWDTFPELFALAPQFRYISGVDPTFLYAQDSALAYAYQDITDHLKKPIPSELTQVFSLFEYTAYCRPETSRILFQSQRQVLCEAAHK